MRQIQKGSVDRSVEVYIIDSTDGTPETGVVWNTAGIDLNYRRDGAAVVAITEATLAALTTAHTDGGFLAIGFGYYRLDLPDAAWATGADHVCIFGTVTGMIVLPQTIQLVNYNPEDAVRLGLTALPNANAEAAGGLYTRGTGAGQIAQDANGNVRVNIDTIKTQAITAAAGVTFPTSIASPTNITAATGIVLSGVTHTGAVIPTVTTVTNQLTTAQINAEVDTAIADARLDELLAADSDIDGLTPPTVGSVFHELLTKTAGSFTYDQTTDSLEAVRDNMGTAQTGDAYAIVNNGTYGNAAIENLVDDIESRIGTPSNLGTGATVAANLVDIEAQTDDIGIAGAGLTAVPWNATWDAEVQSEVDDALVARDLDHLTNNGTAVPAITAGSYLDQIMDDGTAVYDRTTDSLQAVRDRGDAAWITATGFATAAVCTETRLAELDAANLPTDITNVQSDTDNIQTRLPAALVSGRMDSSVGSNLDKGGYSISGIKTTLDALNDISAAQVNTECDTALTDYNAVVPADLPANFALLSIDGSGYVTEVNVDGIKKNSALNNFEFLMVDATDGYTEETGLTVTAQRSIDGGAFGACANSVTEVGNGIYKINLANTDLNGDVITLRFSATGARTRYVTLKTNQ